MILFQNLTLEVEDDSRKRRSENSSEAQLPLISSSSASVFASIDADNPSSDDEDVSQCCHCSIFILTGNYQFPERLSNWIPVNLFSYIQITDY